MLEIKEYNDEYKEEYFNLVYNEIKENERGQSIGSSLLEKAEDYLKSINCKYIDIDVFGTNKKGLEFYMKKVST